MISVIKCVYCVFVCAGGDGIPTPVTCSGVQREQGSILAAEAQLKTYLTLPGCQGTARIGLRWFKESNEGKMQKG